MPRRPQTAIAGDIWVGSLPVALMPEIPPSVLELGKLIIENIRPGPATQAQPYPRFYPRLPQAPPDTDQEDADRTHVVKVADVIKIIDTELTDINKARDLVIEVGHAFSPPFPDEGDYGLERRLKDAVRLAALQQFNDRQYIVAGRYKRIR